VAGEWILATGGAGYIGSHVAVELLSAGYRVVVLDNFENSERDAIDRINGIGAGEVALVEGDVRDQAVVGDLFQRYPVTAVIHLAGKKAVAESVEKPLLYFDANINGALTLFRAMQAAGVERLVFSSSANVYGVPETLPIDESARTGPTNPYGQTKLMIEQIIDGLVVAEPRLSAISLRYFNPVGAHESGLIGENPRDVPNNLFPYIAQTAARKRRTVQVFGDDYPTRDGTGMRDYIHVVDLARGHVAAVDHMIRGRSQGGEHLRINLGTGQGYTVLEAIAAFSKACGFSIPFEITARRPGDVAASLADPSKAHALLGWRARHGLEKMCADHWAFQSRT
jgi:UDP-glucose 4-epimerase